MLRLDYVRDENALRVGQTVITCLEAKTGAPPPTLVEMLGETSHLRSEAVADLNARLNSATTIKLVGEVGATGGWQENWITVWTRNGSIDLTNVEQELAAHAEGNHLWIDGEKIDLDALTD